MTEQPSPEQARAHLHVEPDGVEQWGHEGRLITYPRRRCTDCGKVWA